MSETLLWVLYIVCGGMAFAAVRYLHWPIALSMLAATAVGVLLWYLGVELGKEENEPAWMNVDLAVNGSFCLIFAGAGAAIAFYLRSRSIARDERSGSESAGE